MEEDTMGNKKYSQTQLQAKELGIKNWHVKKERIAKNDKGSFIYN